MRFRSWSEIPRSDMNSIANYIGDFRESNEQIIEQLIKASNRKKEEALND